MYPQHARAGRRRSWRARRNLAGATLASGAVFAAATLAGRAAAQPETGYQFATLGDRTDLTFNQLLGVSSEGVIAGYFGSGAHGHPNKGFLLSPSHRTLLNENYPGAAQTQVTGLNDLGTTVGFWSSTNTVSGTNANDGFYTDATGHFHTVNFPTSGNSTPAVNQLLGVNDRMQTVGFYNDHAGNSHAYEYDINQNHYHPITLPGGGVTSSTAAAISNNDDVAGFATVHGHTEAFLLTWNGHLTWIAARGAAMTQAFGVNDADEVVGAYTAGTGSTAMTHGFVWTPARGLQTVDDPSGIGSTTINGVSDAGQIVGFYTDSKGNTDGMFGTPTSSFGVPGA
jgi:hypothetical protein